MAEEFNPDALCPGIRRIVLWLRDLGYDTTDSGDGVSNEEMECAMDIPNVHMACTPQNLLERADELHQQLALRGITTGDDPWAGACIQATYNPADKGAYISLFSVDDKLMFGGGTKP